MEETRRERSAARDLPADDLRADVRYLGSLLGTVLREQGGDELLAAVERARTRAIASPMDSRSGSSGAASARARNERRRCSCSKVLMT